MEFVEQKKMNKLMVTPPPAGPSPSCLENMKVYVGLIQLESAGRVHVVVKRKYSNLPHELVFRHIGRGCVEI